MYFICIRSFPKKPRQRDASLCPPRREQKQNTTRNRSHSLCTSLTSKLRRAERDASSLAERGCSGLFDIGSVDRVACTWDMRANRGHQAGHLLSLLALERESQNVDCPYSSRELAQGERSLRNPSPHQSEINPTPAYLRRRQGDA